MSETTIAVYLKSQIEDFFRNLKKKVADLSNYKEKSIHFYDDELERIYANGYYLFTYGKYEIAKEIFKSLTDYSPYANFYWRALGAVNQTLKNYDEAISAYDSAIALNNDDIICLVYRAESRFLLGQKDEALKDLHRVLKFSSNDPESIPWINRAKKLLEIHEQQNREVINNGG